MNEGKEEARLKKLVAGDTPNDIPFFTVLGLFGLGGVVAGLTNIQPSADKTYLESLVTPTIPISEHQGYTPVGPIIAGSLFFILSVRKVLQILRK